MTDMKITIDREEYKPGQNIIGEGVIEHTVQGLIESMKPHDVNFLRAKLEHDLAEFKIKNGGPTEA